MLAPYKAVFQYHFPAYVVIPTVVPVNLTESVEHAHVVSHTEQISSPTLK